MPNVWTHMLFCEELINSSENTMPFYQQEVYLNIGAQGPDPFYYHKFWQGKREDAINKLGTEIHLSVCNEFLLDLISSAKNYKEYVKAFVFGFVSHHVLDRMTEPYIRAKADQENISTLEMEIIIDTLLMKKFRHLETWKAPVHKEMDYAARLDNDLLSFLHGKILLHFPKARTELEPNYIRNSYRCMNQAQRISYDPYGWKQYFFPKFISSFSYKPVKDTCDYLNINHAPWHHSVTNCVSLKSFLDLYEEALTKGRQIASEMLAFWKRPSAITLLMLRDLLNEISAPPERSNYEELQLIN